jgi:type IV pilus assembly protein PilV
MLKQSGSSIVEGMVALLIFSIGMLGLMNLQAISINQSSDSKYRADAAFLANQIIGQMWADQSNIATYAYNAGLTPAALAATTYDATVQTPAGVLNSWMTNLQTLLPRASPNMQQILIGANNVVTVTVRWWPQQEPSPHNHVVTTQIQVN